MTDPSPGPVYFCWHCYARVPAAQGPCPQCGLGVAPPPDTDYTSRLIWALHHPLPDTRITAARVLGARREPRGASTLQAIALASDDPYLVATALDALVRIRGIDAVRPVLEVLSEEGAAPARRLARRLLAEGVADETERAPLAPG